jgi:predicted nucleic acid-binding protein
MSAIRRNCFDASALIKRYVREEGSDVIREYWSKEASKLTTSLCFYETLTLLKVNYFYRKNLTRENYNVATLDLCSWFTDTVLENYSEPNFLSPTVFLRSQKMAALYQLDLSDAVQILSVKESFGAYMWRDDSRTILVTADKKLAKAARAEALRVWSVLEEPAPR